jgi:hypothetical protein
MPKPEKEALRRFAARYWYDLAEAGDPEQVTDRLVRILQNYERWKTRRRKAKPRPKKGRMQQLPLFEA